MKRKLQRLSDRIRKGEEIPLPLSLMLHVLTPIQRLGMWQRARKSVVRVEARVVSFGNLTTGGSGKTPAVIARALEELAAGKRVAVLTRGYGSRKTSEPLVVDEADQTVNVARDVGDEPALIRKCAPGVTLVKSADRIAGARAAVEAGCDVIILDDGFQSLSLHRDENILCVDSLNPFGNGALVPRGILREPIEAMKRATEVILTRCDQAENLAQLEETIRRHAPGVSVRRTIHAPTELVAIGSGETLPLAWLQGREIVAACGIGHPEAFVNTLTDLGAGVHRLDAFGDHAAFDAYTWSKDYPTVITEKDAVRLEERPDTAFALVVRLSPFVASPKSSQGNVHS